MPRANQRQRHARRVGGWPFQRGNTSMPDTDDTGVVLAALAGLNGPRANRAVFRALDDGIAWLRDMQNPDGGFRYMLSQGPPDSGFARTAAGVVALYNTGMYDGPEIIAGLEFLTKHLPGRANAEPEAYYFYGHYYAAQAMWHAGDERWGAWYPAIRDQLTARQREDGSWMDPVGPEYGTAMACIVLQTPNNYLPILQR